MENKKPEKFPVNIDEAMNIVSGTRKYQKLMILILSLSNTAIFAMIDCSHYYLPDVPADCTSPSSCESYEFFKNSAAFDFGLFESSRNLRDSFFTYYNIGKIIGCLVPWLADIYGRKKIIIYNCILGVFSFTLLALSVNQTLLYISAFLIGIVELGILVTTIILCVETMDFKKRNIYIQMIWIIMPMCSIIFIVLLQLQVPWRYVLLICPLSILVQLLFMPYIQESPRYLLTNRCNIKAATKAINKISLRNGEGTFDYILASESSKTASFISIREIITSKILMLQIIVGNLAWLLLITGYYGSTLVMPEDFQGSFWLYIFIHIANILCELLLIVAVIFFGRKKTVASNFLIVGIIFIIITPIEFLKIDNDVLKILEICLLSVIRVSFPALVCLIYLFTAEMFPTNIRSAAFCLCSIAGRITESTGLGKLMFSNLSVCALIIGVFTILGGASMVVFQETGGKEIDEVADNNQHQPLLRNV